ncbi:signal recognition particle-docking protein FtsY [Botrimarina hoheduenensis]|uniref:Signal recognition particle receptor FtsY n=1 Tax=Botrimarina hoheduenensis TaxID=2528000 RepID=A0A5C5WFN5_9BACT|nr:signal recognition particle-docking protein FtsY [Botrimarina hoheduenensis]TWT48905.1 Signal recognition particle receptor FtsY [Botrimarina hoheduenensis]
MGFFDRIKQGLKKTGSLLKTDIRDLFKSEGRLIDEAFLEEIRGILFRTDMGFDAVDALVDEIATKLRGRVVELAEVVDVLKVKLKELMAQPESPIDFAPTGPTIVMVCGVNGAGKTTSIAKLASQFTRSGKRVVLGAGDTFRAAAVEQLTIWADRLGASIVKAAQGTHPATVAYQTVERAIAEPFDVAVIDTAGRLQTQTTLMAELTKIRQAISKQLPDAPHEVLLVLDATTGQNGVSQAQKFADAAGCTGIVLAKLDGTAKGGVVVAIRQQLGLPVKYVGVGEGHEDLTPFVPDEFVDALFADVLQPTKA